MCNYLKWHSIAIIKINLILTYEKKLSFTYLIDL